MSLLYCQQVKKEVGGSHLFSIKELRLQRGEKIGFIGENGLGKTSLLNILVGQDRDYEGQVFRDGDFAYLPQLRPSEELSGGEQVLKLLKQALASRASLLILDEPTANLDGENRQWLIHQLRKFRGSLLVVSHDRDFLDQVVSSIWLLEGQAIKVYPGNFSQAQLLRQQERQQQTQAHQAYEKEAKRLASLAQRKKQDAQKMTKRSKKVSGSDWKVRSQMGSYDSQAKSLAKTGKALEARLERLERVDEPRKETQIKMVAKGSLLNPPHTLFSLKPGSLWRKDRFLFDYPELRLHFGDKVILRGPNGSGKTSLVSRLYQKDLEGYYGKGLAMSYFSQTLADYDGELTVYETVSRDSIQSQQTILNLLGMLGLPYHKAHQKIKTLSGGEGVRMQLAKVLLSDANLLILDEPTNFLDLPAIIALEQFLQSYPGSFLLISHDQRLLETLKSKTWLLKNQSLSVE